MALTKYQKEQKEKRIKEKKERSPASEVKEDELNWYDGTWAMENKCLYNIVYGGRGNGKTYFFCRKILERWFEDGTPSAYIRRYGEEIRPGVLADLFNPHLDYIKEMSEGKYNTIGYKTQKFTLEYRDEENKLVRKSEPFCYTASISTAMNSKGSDKGQIYIMVFDEFLSREGYLVNEYVRWNNVISTFVRQRAGTRIFMLGNTVDYHCPYWREYGLYNINKMKEGDRTVFFYGTSNASMGVEYSRPVTGEKGTSPVQDYFAFNNPKLKMITDGTWELPDFQRPPRKFDNKAIRFTFYIKYLEDQIKGHIIQDKEKRYLLFYPMGEEEKIENEDKQIIYQEMPDGNPLHLTNLVAPEFKPTSVIYKLIAKGQMFFEDGQTAETVRAYCRDCGKSILN